MSCSIFVIYTKFLCFLCFFFFQGQLFDSCVKLHVLFLTLVSAMFAVTLSFLLIFHIWLLTRNKTTLGKTLYVIPYTSYIYVHYLLEMNNICLSLSFRMVVSPFFCGWTRQRGVRRGYPSKFLTGVWKEKETLAISSI